jgi:FMN phosphatase YigB (HAD superfamily)
MLEHFQLPSNLVTYVGDDPARDVDAAKNQGLNAILYSVDRDRYSEPWRDYHVAMKNPPDAVIEDLVELLDIIE